MTVVGRCYCGATEFELDAAPDSLTSCNCSFCSRTGALWAYFTPDEVRFTRRDDDRLYAPNVNRHHFCGVCGMTTYTESPTWDHETHIPDFTRMRVTINALLLEDVDLSAIPHHNVDGRHLW